MDNVLYVLYCGIGFSSLGVVFLLSSNKEMNKEQISEKEELSSDYTDELSVIEPNVQEEDDIEGVKSKEGSMASTNEEIFDEKGEEKTLNEVSLVKENFIEDDDFEHEFERYEKVESDNVIPDDIESSFTSEYTESKEEEESLEDGFEQTNTAEEAGESGFSLRLAELRMKHEKEFEEKNIETSERSEEESVHRGEATENKELVNVEPSATEPPEEENIAELLRKYNKSFEK